MREMKRGFVLILCLALLAGCSSNETQQSDSGQLGSQNSASGQAPSSQEESQTMLGKVTYMTENTLSLLVYEAMDGAVEDLAALDLGSLSATGAHEQIEIAENAAFFAAAEGLLVPAERGDLVQESIIAISADADGVQQIILLSVPQSDEAEPEEAEAPIVARVDEVGEDQRLSLTLYRASDGNESIEDYHAVDFSRYERTGETQQYLIGDVYEIARVVGGEAQSMEAAEIQVGDMLVIYTNEAGVPSIVLYRPEG